VQYATELDNRFLPFMRGSDITCYEAFHGEKPDNSWIERDKATWGCKAYVHIEKHRRKDGKWDPTAIAGVFLGTAFHMGYKAYIISDLAGKRIYIAKHNVTLDDSKFPWRKAENTADDTTRISINTGEPMPFDDVHDDTDTHYRPELIMELDVEEEEVVAITDTNPDIESHVRTRSMTRAKVDEHEIHTRTVAEKSRINEAQTDAEAKERTIEPPSEPQLMWSKVHEAADELLTGIEKRFGKQANFMWMRRQDEVTHTDLNKAMLQYTGDIDTQQAPATLSLLSHYDEPKSITEALDGDDADGWWEATKAEMESWKSLKVFKRKNRRNLPQGTKVIDSRMVYKRKIDGFNNRTRFKARLVARGFQQTDVQETFAPMAHPVTIRAIIALAVAKAWKLEQGDVKTAYLHAKLDTPVYLRPPDGLGEAPDTVFELERAVYGLAASGRLWWLLFSKKNKEFGMTSVTHDDCVFTIRRGPKGPNEKVLIVAVVVDDCLIACNCPALKAEWLSYMNEFFELSDDGPLKYYLGVSYTHHGDGISATQDGYIDRCCAKYGLTDAKPVTTPMEHKFEVDPDELSVEPDPKILEEYRQVVGSLIYCSVWTRPDVSFSVNFLARFMSKPNKRLLMAAKRVLVYLRSTPGKGIHFRHHNDKDIAPLTLTAYADTSDADCKFTSKSTGGYMLFIHGAPIAWKSGRLPLVTLSSAESEYVQVTMACQEILYLREVMELLGEPQGPTVIREDNQAAIAICNNPCHRSRTRHIRRRYHFIRQCIADKSIYMSYVQSESNVADMMTKPLADGLFSKLRRLALNE